MTLAGVDHLVLAVEDVDTTVGRVVDESGCPAVTVPTDVEAAGRRVTFVAEADGYVVVFVEGE